MTCPNSYPCNFEHWASNQVEVSGLNTVWTEEVPQVARKETQVMLRLSVHLLLFSHGKQVGQQHDSCFSMGLLQAWLFWLVLEAVSSTSTKYQSCSRNQSWLEMMLSICLPSVLLATALVGCHQTNKGYSCCQMQNRAFPSGPCIQSLYK